MKEWKHKIRKSLKRRVNVIMLVVIAVVKQKSGPSEGRHIF
jgi:hypothetical protein